MRLPLLMVDHQLLRGLTGVFLEETQMQLLAFLSIKTHSVARDPAVYIVECRLGG